MYDLATKLKRSVSLVTWVLCRTDSVHVFRSKLKSSFQLHTLHADLCILANIEDLDMLNMSYFYILNFLYVYI